MNMVHGGVLIPEGTEYLEIEDYIPIEPEIVDQIDPPDEPNKPRQPNELIEYVKDTVEYNRMNMKDELEVKMI